MFTLEIDDHAGRHTFYFSAAQARQLLDANIAEARHGLAPVYSLMGCAPPSRTPKKVANKYSRLAFVVNSRVHWVPKVRFAELEAAVRGAVLGHNTYFGMVGAVPGTDPLPGVSRSAYLHRN
jgi:hypothetical protein